MLGKSRAEGWHTERIFKGTEMFRPSREMIMRDLQEALWQRVEPRIDSLGPAADTHREIIRKAIQRFVEEKASSMGMTELADALHSLEQTAALFMEELRSRGIAGDPI